MPAPKLDIATRASLTKRAAYGENPKALAKEYGVSVVYVYKLAKEYSETKIAPYAIEIDSSPKITLEVSASYDIGDGKDGKPLLAFIGREIKPILSMDRENFVWLTIKGQRVKAFIGKSTRQAIENEGKAPQTTVFTVGKTPPEKAFEQDIADSQQLLKDYGAEPNHIDYLEDDLIG